MNRLSPYLAFFLLLTLASCTFKSVAVNNLEQIVSFRLGGQLHLYFAQRSELKDKLQAWILATEQKEKVLKLSVLMSEFDWKKSNLKETYLTINQVYLNVATSFNQILAESLGQLDEKQQQKFFASMEKENRKIKEDETPTDGIRRMLVFCFGEITPAQEELLTKVFDSESSPSQTRLQRRLSSQQALREIYLLQESLEKRTSLMKSALDESVKRPPDSAQIEKNLFFFNELVQTLTPEQLKTFETKRLEILETLDLLLKRT